MITDSVPDQILNIKVVLHKRYNLSLSGTLLVCVAHTFNCQVENHIHSR